MNNHKEQVTYGVHYRHNALNPCLSIKEDYRRGPYYVKHMHQMGTNHKCFFVFKDNPAPGRNWRGDEPLHIEFSGDKPQVALDKCIEWISRRRCFNKEV